MVILLIQAGIIIFNNFILEEEISLIYISSGIIQKSGYYCSLKGKIVRKVTQLPRPLKVTLQSRSLIHQLGN